MKTFNFAIIFSCFLFVVSDGRGLKSEVKPSLGSVAAQESDKLEFPKKPVLATSLVSDDSRQINSTSHSEAGYTLVSIAFVKDNPCAGNQQRDQNGKCRDPA
ncbi:hypothetical protein HUJ04_011600 [Dendroctonus ponderosae]